MNFCGYNLGKNTSTLSKLPSAKIRVRTVKQEY